MMCGYNLVFNGLFPMYSSCSCERACWAKTLLGYLYSFKCLGFREQQKVILLLNEI